MAQQGSTAFPYYASGAHAAITRKAFELSGVEVKAVGTGITVRAPWDQRPDFSTYIPIGMMNNDILVLHSSDPDLYSIILRWQEEHSAFDKHSPLPAPWNGLAPYETSRFAGDSVNSEDDLRWLYLSWALHYLEDCGMPLHTYWDPAMLVDHTAIEKKMDDELERYWALIGDSIEVKTVTDIYKSAWELADYSARQAPVLYQAYKQGDDAVFGETAAKVIAETTGYVAGAIKNLDVMYVGTDKPVSAVSLLAISVPLVVIGAAVAGGK